MARIVGVSDGLRAQSMQLPERKLRHAPTAEVCKFCQGILPTRRVRGYAANVAEEFEGACLHCSKLFGMRWSGAYPFNEGVTNLTPDECITRIDRLRIDSWGIVLISRSFGAAGHTIEIEPGDIVKINRAGLSEGAGAARETCSHERSKERFSIAVSIGPIPLILWPHEIAAVSFITIMDLKRAGEIEESFVAQEDECGYFKPTDEMREQIYDLFGGITGRPARRQQ